MNLIKGNSYSVKIKKINDVSKLYEEFGQIERIETPLQPDIYWLLECQNSSLEKTVAWRKVIAQNSAELPPSLLLEESKVFIGAHAILLTLALKTGRVIFKTDLLNGTFLFFLHSEENPLVIAICEFEIYTFDSSGTLVWKLDLPEVIRDVIQVGDTLEVRDLSDQIYRFNVSSGLKAF